MSGEARGPAATLLRAATSVVEPFYAATAAARNRLFDAGILRSVRLPRPVISIGNITTGGTGKTPLVRWLASRLRAEGKHVAVLSRGYKASAGALGDEQLMLDRLFNGPGTSNPVSVVANPDRVTAAVVLLRDRPETNVFLLDDGFQHRKVRRDLDVVLVSATSPFGYGHVLPRGMLREPISGLARAGAFVVTHTDAVDAAALGEIERQLRRHNPQAPLYHAVHAPAALRAGDQTLPMDALRDKAWFGFCGIGDPASFLKQLESTGGRRVGWRQFPDHHHYSGPDLDQIDAEATAAGAEVIATTEKDWAKVNRLVPSRRDASAPPVWRVDVELRFRADGGELLWDQVWRVVS